ncbi:hypothetical protein NUM3379_08490 [Kineococcus sp. NUM-3379]
MTVGSLLRVLARRWYLTVPLLVLVALAGQRAWAGARPLYQASANVLVMPSVALSTPLPEQLPGTQPGSRNPFSLAGGAGTLAANVADSLNTSRVREILLSGTPGAELAVTPPASAAQSRNYFPVTVLTPTPEAAEPLLEQVVQQANQQLLDLQRRVQAPDNGLFIAVRSTPVDGPTELYPQRARATGAILLGGLALTTLLVVALDALLLGLARRRRDRRGHHHAPQAEGPDVDLRARNGTGAAAGVQGGDGLAGSIFGQPQPGNRDH